MIKSLKYSYLIIIITLYSCGNKPNGNVTENNKPPILNPDYSEIIIPSNIAPINFIIKDEGSSFYVELSSGAEPAIRIKSKNGLIRIPQKKWKKLLTTDTFKDLNIDVFVKEKKRGMDKI